MAISKFDVYDQLDKAVRTGVNPVTVSCRDIWRGLGKAGSLETISKYKKAWLAEKHPHASAPAPAPTKRPVSLLPSELAKLRMLLDKADEIEMVVEEYDARRRERRESYRR